MYTKKLPKLIKIGSLCSIGPTLQFWGLELVFRKTPHFFLVSYTPATYKFSPEKSKIIHRAHFLKIPFFIFSWFGNGCQKLKKVKIIYAHFLMAKNWANIKKLGIGKKIFSRAFIWLQSQRSSSDTSEVIASYFYAFGGWCLDFLVFLCFRLNS